MSSRITSSDPADRQPAPPGTARPVPDGHEPDDASRAVVAEWLRRSTAAQGVEEKVADPETIMRLVQLMDLVRRDERPAA